MVAIKNILKISMYNINIILEKYVNLWIYKEKIDRPNRLLLWNMCVPKLSGLSRDPIMSISPACWQLYRGAQGIFFSGMKLIIIAILRIIYVHFFTRHFFVCFFGAKNKTNNEFFLFIVASLHSFYIE